MRLVVLSLLVICLQTVSTASHAELRPKPGTDLMRLSSTAKSGEVIHLSAGAYPGQIQAVGKTLTVVGKPGKTILTGSKAQSIAYVTKKGRLTLSGVTFKTRSKDGLAVYVKGGRLVLKNCNIAKTVQPAIYADQGSVSVESCRFSDLANSGIVGANKSTIEVSKSRFEKIAKSGVVGQKSGSVTIRDSLFSGVKEEAVYVTGKIVLRVEKSIFRNVVKDAVVLNKGSRGDVNGNSFEDLPGTGVVAIAGSSVSVIGNRFRAVRKTAIHIENGGTHSIKNNVMAGPGGGIVVLKGAPAALVSGNSITGMSADKTGITVQANGAVAIVRNTIIGGRTGINVRGKFDKAGANRGYASPLTVRQNTVLNQNKRSLDLEAYASTGKPAEISGNRLLNAGELAVLVSKSPRVAFTGNLALSASKESVFLQNGAVVQFRGNIIGARKEAVVFGRGAAEGSRYSDDIFIGAVSVSDHVKGDAMAKRIGVVIRDGSLQSTLAVLMSTIGKSTTGLTSAKDVTKLQEILAPLLQRTKAIRRATADVAFIAMKGIDVAGNKFDGAYTVLNSRGIAVSQEKTVAPNVAVMPGTYFVEPAFAPKLVKKVKIAPGKVTTVTVKSRRHLVLSLVKWDRRSRRYHLDRLPVLIAGRSAMRRALTPGREAGDIRWLGTRRADATAKDLAEALALARGKEKALEAGLRASFKKISADTSKLSKDVVDRDIRENIRWSQARQWWESIMAVAGTADDARRLVEKAVAGPSSNMRYLGVAAAIERRLGILDRGALVKVLKTGKRNQRIETARILRVLGSSAGDAVLLGVLEKIDFDKGLAMSEAYRSISPLSDMKHPNILSGARGVLARARQDMASMPKEKDGGYKQFNQNVAVSAAAKYLLAYGNLKDWRQIAATPILVSAIGRVISIFDDPVAAIRFDLGLSSDRKPYYRPRQAAANCRWFLDLPPARFDSVHKEIEQALYKALRKSARANSKSSSIARQVRYEYRTHAGWCRPQANVAETIYNRGPVWILNEARWIPRNWDSKGTIANYLKADAGGADTGRLDGIGHKALAVAFGDGKAPSNIKMPDLFLAYHKVASRRCTQDLCAAVFRSNDDPPGAVTANYRIRPYFLNDRLRIALRPRSGTYKQTSLASMIGGMLHHVDSVRDSAGKSLIREAFLMRGDKKIALKEVGRNEQGEYLYEAKLDKLDLRDLRLHFRLQFVKQTEAIDFDLTAVPAARDLRIAAKEIARASQQAKSAPSDNTALRRWGDGLRRTGQLDAAWQKYETILRGNPQDAALWLTAGRMFSKLELHKQAQKVLAEGVEKFGGRAARPKTKPYARLGLALANAAFKNEDYATSEKSYGLVAGLMPRDTRWKWWQAANQMILGRYPEANAFFRTAGSRYQGLRSPLFRYLSAVRGAKDDAGPAAKALEEPLNRMFDRLHLKKKAKLPEGKRREIIAAILSPGNTEAENMALGTVKNTSENCTLQTLLGVRDLGGANDKLARARLKSAVSTCEPRRLERRLARAELARPKQGGGR